MVLSPGPVLTVASLNLHAGVDAANVPFDVAEACAALDADVVVLQEVWWPSGGQSQAADVADALGYEVHWVSFGTGQRFAVRGGEPGRVGRWTGRPPAVVLDGRIPPPSTGGTGARRPARSRLAARAGGEPGQLGLAVLSRLPARSSPPIGLRVLGRDGALRHALPVTVVVGRTEATVVGVHMAHLSQGSLLQYADLRRAVRSLGPRVIVAGDMNLWGPVVVRLLPGWQRAVTGRSWPAHLPISQPDHILVGEAWRTLSGETLPGVGSDHRPVRARLQPV